MLALVLFLQTTTTNCYPVGSTVQCTSATSPSVTVPPPLDYGPLLRQQQEASDNLRDLRAAMSRQKAERQAAEQRDLSLSNDAAYQRYIEKLIAAGRCRAARADALQQGKYELVQAVDSYCRPAADEPVH